MKTLTKSIARSVIAGGTLMGLSLLCASAQADSISLGEPDSTGDRLNLSEGYSIAENQTPNLNAPFLMPIEDVFIITGRGGTVVKGTIESGIIKVNETVEVVGAGRDGRDKINSAVTGIEMFGKKLDRAEAGNTVEILLRGINKEDIERGMVIAKPGSIKAHAKFEAAVYNLKPEEGGRGSAFFEGYRPQFRLRTADVTGTMSNFFSANGVPIETVNPGDNVKITVELIRSVPIAEGLKFKISEGGRTIGSGEITRVRD